MSTEPARVDDDIPEGVHDGSTGSSPPKDNGLWIAIGGGVVVALVLGVLTYLLWPRGTTRITREEAVETFRGSDNSPTTAESDGRRVPPAGVYSYAAEGQEEVKLGPLPAQTRPFPPSVTAVSVDAGGGCFDWTVNLFVEHTETTRWCTDAGLRLETNTKHQTVGALNPTFTMSCDPGTVLLDPPDPSRPSTLQCTIEVAGGPVSVRTEVTGTATTGSPTPVRVGGEDVTATPVEVHIPVQGTINGTWDETTWWGPGHLPLRIRRSLDLTGPATFKETSSLQLVDMEPAR